MAAAKHILIVEDDQGIRESIQDYLELEGYQTHAAQNGREGLEVLKSLKEPCLILLDLMMPVMNGWEFLEAKKANSAIADLPVIVVSAIGDETPKPTGIQDFIRKPIDLNRLFVAVRTYCGVSG